MILTICEDGSTGEARSRELAYIFVFLTSYNYPATLGDIVNASMPSSITATAGISVVSPEKNDD
jgi:hypothetical protein